MRKLLHGRFPITCAGRSALASMLHDSANPFTARMARSRAMTCSLSFPDWGQHAVCGRNESRSKCSGAGHASRRPLTARSGHALMQIPPTNGPAGSAYAVDAPVKSAHAIGGPGGEEQCVHGLTRDAIAELKRVEAVNDDWLA